MTAWAGTPRDMREELTKKSGLPVECGVSGEDVIVCFEALSGENLKPWTKRFILPKSDAVPTAFLMMLDGWKREMNKKLARHDTAGVLGAVLREYGEERVRLALREMTGVMQ